MVKRLIVLLFLITLLFIPNTTLAATTEKEVWVEEAQVIVGNDNLPIQIGKTLEFIEGEKAELLIHLSKTTGAKGVITLSSDLIRFEGLLKFRLEDYPESAIEIRCSGIIPDALVKEDRTSRIGETSFILLNITHDRDGIVQTVTSITAVATNPELKQSKSKIVQTTELLTNYPLSERQAELAKAILSAAKQAGDTGNPTLAVTLCNVAQQLIQQQTGNQSPAIWYWLLLAVFAIAFILMTALFFSQNKKSETRGWIKPRK